MHTEKVPEDVSWSLQFFRIFAELPYKFLSVLYTRSLEYKISHCLSANQNSELRCVICTGVTLFALVLHMNCTALRQTESSNFFMCIITVVNVISTTLTDLFVISQKDLNLSYFGRDETVQ